MNIRDSRIFNSSFIYFSSTPDVLKAGILDSHALVVVTSEQHNLLEDESYYDSLSIFAIQNISKY